MRCPKCGEEYDNNDRFCTACGSPIAAAGRAEEKIGRQEPEGRGLIGYSPLINDPAFARYMKNTKIWSLAFAAVLAVVAIGGFYIYGETSAEMDNPEALLIGLAIGGMFLLIAVFQTIGRARSTTWDGVVVDKKIEKKRRKRHSGDDHYWQNYQLYTVSIKKDNGKMHFLSTEDDDTVYNYYKVGDKVRHHKGLNSIEKYDKSGDTMIFCSACASLNDIKDDTCFRCSCPLLK
ncbi:zinc ribbon domain-containing protein [Dehalobacter sp. DCM]|uniref:zinc ribbon domain-containing protein n=1 Tax=Dehalobacter sp. DCM TaxID=2907827 RepID=UPI003081A6B8|nr:zinc ribbon domain-containing protein [Dehalobacter sp. DCM]